MSQYDERLRPSRTGAANERVVCPGMESVYQLLQTDVQAAETGAAREQNQTLYEAKPQMPYQRLLASPDIPEADKARLRAEYAPLNPFALKKKLSLSSRASSLCSAT